MTNNIENSALDFHKSGQRPGKISLKPTKPLLTQSDMSMAYSPGVAAPCIEIHKNPEKVYDYTSKGNYVAVITNGTAVLGLGNIGILAAKPVMEGKAILMKKFADIDAMDIEIDSTDTNELINIIKKISAPWGAINLEDIKSPECFEIEETLKKELDIPVFHDDQHGTAIIVAAGLLNAAEITNRDFTKMKIVINGPGAAGIACGRLLYLMGIDKKNITYCDSIGVLYAGRTENMNKIKKEIALETNARTLSDALNGADVFLGLSTKDALIPDMLKHMNPNPIIFAMANPDPEIKPEIAIDARPDAIIATGRSDYPNQINNVMCFPYIFRGALDVRAKDINNEMKIAAAYAIAKIAKEPIPEEVIQAYSNSNFELKYGPKYIIPSPFDPRLLPNVATAVAEAAIATNVAQNPIENITNYKNKLSQTIDPNIATLTTLYANAKNNLKRIIFTEGEEANTIRAAIHLRDNGYAKPILIGDHRQIEKKFSEMGIQNTENITIINSELSKNIKQYTDYIYNKLNRSGFLYRDCARAVKCKRNTLAACILACGHGDAMITGLTMNYKNIINDISEILIEPNDTAFGMAIASFDNKTIFIADTSIIEDPTSEQLAEIAIEASKKVFDLGFAPRVAFIDASNFGSNKSYNQSKIQKTIEILNNRKSINFEYDGEMSIGIALNYKKIQSRYPFCKLTSSANILIMPNITTANATYMTIKEINDARIIGPVLLGISHSIQILDIDSTTSDIINSAIWAISNNTNIETSEHCA